jgi:DNA-binding transcriptional LysR family regulator
VNDPRLALSAVRDGLGLLQLLPDYVESFLAAGELETVLDDWMPPPLDAFFLYYPSRRQIRAPLQAFVNFLRQGTKVRARRPRST